MGALKTFVVQFYVTKLVHIFVLYLVIIIFFLQIIPTTIDIGVEVGCKYCILCWWCIWMVSTVVWRNLSDIVQLSFVVCFFLLSLLEYLLLLHISCLERTIGHHLAPVAISLYTKLVNTMMWFWCMMYVGIMNCISGKEKCQVQVLIIQIVVSFYCKLSSDSNKHCTYISFNKTKLSSILVLCCTKGLE